MEGKEAYPKWLIETKKTVGKAKEWKNFIAALQGAVDQHLKENHVPSFADLAPAERILFVDRASRSLQTGSNYDQLYNATSHLLDQQVNNTVAKEMLSDNSAVGVGKPELINEHLKDGVVSILKRWPEMKVKFHMCLNIPIPTKLRTNAWTLFMSDPRARKDYVEKLMKEPKKAISDQDQLISQTCENMLRIQNTFSDIGPPTVGSFFAMKAVLSYFHAQQNDTEELHHVYYLLILPMLHTLSPHISKTKPAANNVVMILVEMYLTFIRDRPKYVCDIKNEHRTELKSFSDKVAEHLAAYEKSTQGNLATFIACLSQTGQRQGAVDRTVLVPMLSEVLVEVVSPLIMSMFVGFLNKDTLMYIWDQYIIGLDVAGYHMFLLPAFTATLFILLADDILRCENIPDLISTVQRELCKVNIRLVQAKMKALHMNVLHAELNQDDKAAIATIDPTKVGERTWNHWNNAIIPERISVQQKQEAREARQAERERLLKLRKQQEIQARLQEQPRFPVRDGSVPDDALAQELAEERRRHEAHNLSYQKELKALRQEIQELKGEPAPNDRSYSVQSYERLTAPPPSRTSGNSILPVEVAPAKSMPTATNILLDVMSAVADKFRKVAHGEGREGEKLRDATKQYIQEHEEDDRQAQLKIFGKELKVGEFESLKEPEKTRKGERVKQISNKRFEDRWAAKNA